MSLLRRTQPNGGASRLRNLLRRPEIGVVASLVVIWTVFYILSPKFLSPMNLSNIFAAAAETGIIAVGIAFLLISGEFDISVGSVYTVTPMLMIRLANNFQIPLAVGLLIGLATASLVGLINGTLVVKFRFPSFIVTLATMLLLSGIVLAITGGFITEYGGRPLLFAILVKRVGGFRVSIFWLLGIAAIFAIILENTRYGNAVCATGGNPAVARRLGINVSKVKMINFVFCSLLAGFAGCVGAARVYSVNPTVGFDLMFNAIAAAVIGGCLVTGGRGSIIGTFLGVILLTSVSSGLILAGASPYWYRAFVGAIILLAVIVNYEVTRRIKHAE
jgi:simple sugar transport system permease protein